MFTASRMRESNPPLNAIRCWLLTIFMYKYCAKILLDESSSTSWVFVFSFYSSGWEGKLVFIKRLERCSSNTLLDLVRTSPILEEAPLRYLIICLQKSHVTTIISLESRVNLLRVSNVKDENFALITFPPSTNFFRVEHSLSKILPEWYFFLVF